MRRIGSTPQLYNSQFVDDEKRVVVGVPGVRYICDTLVQGIYDERERGEQGRVQCREELAELREKARDAFQELGEELRDARAKRAHLEEEVRRGAHAVEVAASQREQLGGAGAPLPEHAHAELSRLASELQTLLAQLEALRAEKAQQERAKAEVMAHQREAEAAVETLQRSAHASLRDAHAEYTRICDDRRHQREAYAQTIHALQSRLQQPPPPQAAAAPHPPAPPPQLSYIT
eukprot:TRINITY_DN15971_c0_g1_i1.p1 TRINITY_DN15971_c0_g1~~TRINITY_DN15971_c0_g1_i1.p1  ORF type:complete len:233 (+),score=89.64 TRINITY_DN15971_c0_g1_i1:43-741(+)